jgi:hypothetical protein
MEISRNELDFASDLMRAAVELRKPKMNKEQQEILGLIYGNIQLDDPSFIHDPLTPTPLDGDHLFFAGAPYSGAAIVFLQGRFDDRLTELGLTLPSRQKGIIMESIATEHFMRLQQNEAGLIRLQQGFLKDPKSVSLEDAHRTYRARSASADQIDLIKLITSHPELESIEDTRYTKPLDHIAITKASKDVLSRTRRIRYDYPNFEMRILSREEQNAKSRFVHMGDLSNQGILGTKTPIIEAKFKGIELVKKKREYMFMFPADQLLGNTPSIIRIIKGREANIQKLGFTTYWTLAHHETGEEPVTQFEQPSMYSPAGMSRIAIESAMTYHSQS